MEETSEDYQDETERNDYEEKDGGYVKEHHNNHDEDVEGDVVGALKSHPLHYKAGNLSGVPNGNPCTRENQTVYSNYQVPCGSDGSPCTQENQTVYSNYQVPCGGDGSDVLNGDPCTQENQTVYSNYQVPQNDAQVTNESPDALNVYSNYQVPCGSDGSPCTQENQTVYSNYQVPYSGDGSDVLSGDPCTQENQTVYSNYQVPQNEAQVTNESPDVLDSKASEYPFGPDLHDSLEARCDSWPEDRGDRPLFIEIHSGNDQLTSRMLADGFQVVSINLADWDLGARKNRVELLQMIVDLEPDIVWCTPECSLWKPWRDHQLDDPNSVHDLDKERDTHHRNYLTTINEIYRAQLRGGRIAVVELPRTSVAWQSRAIDGLRKSPTKLQVTHTRLAEPLPRRCSGDHAHSHRQEPGHTRSFCDVAARCLVDAYTYQADEAIPVQRPPPRTAASGDGEVLAARKLKDKAFDVRDLQEVAEALQLSRRRRHRRIYGGKEVYVEGIVGGLWTHGGMTGISSASGDVPNFVSYVNAFMREKTGPQAAWSSFALNKNVATDVHCDHHNLPGSPSYTITFGDFTGGGIWIHDENVEEHKRVMRRDPNGNELKGYVVSTQGDCSSV